MKTEFVDSSLSLSRSGPDSPLADLHNVAMYRVDELSREQILESENIVLKSTCAAAVVREEESGVVVLRILRCGKYSREDLDLEVAQELAGFLNLDPMVVSLLLSPQIPRTALEQMMQRQNIGQLAEIVQEVDDVLLNTVEVDFASSPIVMVCPCAVESSQQHIDVFILYRQTRRTRRLCHYPKKRVQFKLEESEVKRKCTKWSQDLCRG